MADARREDLRVLPGVSPPAVALAAGALWGLAGYAILWGHTPLAASRRFVVSVLGTIALLPVRIVLWSIRTVEDRVGHPFNFPDSNWWIGALAAVVGAIVALAAFLAVRAGARLLGVGPRPG